MGVVLGIVGIAGIAYNDIIYIMAIYNRYNTVFLYAHIIIHTLLNPP